MSTIKVFIRTSKKKPKESNLRFRLSDGKNVQLFHSSEITINPEHWDNRSQDLKPKIPVTDSHKKELRLKIALRKDLISDIYNTKNVDDILNSSWLESKINERLNPDKKLSREFFDDFEMFLKMKKYSNLRIKAFRIVIRALNRFELFYQLEHDPNFKISFNSFDLNILSQFESFLKDEHTLLEKYPSIYEFIPEKKRPGPRGQNHINGLLIRLRTFFIWATETIEITDKNPFKKYEIGSSVYGTPFYITIEERNKIATTNLSRHPELAIQRDIFIFQCLIGCRVGDLYKINASNVINGAIEYIPRKTRDGRPVTVRVPLNEHSRRLVDKYLSKPGSTFPFIAEQNYNKAIKKIFLAARLTRPVVILDPTTREQRIRPLNEIASSHLARRTFVGNLYKKVQDPNLISPLSGHVEGSKAFSRYREIDEQMKQELVKLLE